MDSLELELKVTANTQAIEDISAQLDKLKKSSKETSDGFSLADTKVGGLFKSIQEGVEKGVTSFKTLSGAIMATGIGLLLIAVTSLIQYFKTTNEGANIMKGIMSALGQAIREGPKIAFDALKIAFEVLTLPMRTILLIAGNMIQVFKGKESLSEAVKNVKDGIKEMTDEIKKNAQDIAGAGADIKKSYELSKKWEELQQKIAQDKVKEAEIETRIAELRDKAQEVKESDLSADEKARQQLDLLNQAKGLIHEKDTIALTDAQAALVIAKEQLALAPKDTEAIKKVQDAELEIQRIKQEGFQADKAIERQKLGASKELQKSKEDEAKELEKIQEKILEDSLQGRKKDIAAAEFEYKTEFEKAKGSAELQKALTEKRDAEILAINIKYDKEDSDAKKKKAEEDFKEQQKQWQEIDKATDEHIQTLLKINEEEHKNRKISDKKYLDDKYTLEIMLAKGNAAKIKLIDQQIADEKKKLHQLEVKNTLDALNQTLDMVSEAAGKGTIVGKAAAIASIGINTAKGIMAAWASSEELGPILGPILAAVQTAALVVMGAKQAAEVAKEKPPAKQKLDSGGFIGGTSMTGDQVPVMANSGEFMVNNRTMSNPQLASAIMNMNANPLGGVQGGNTLTEERVVQLAAQTVKGIPIVNSEHFTTLAANNVKYREGIFTVK